MNVKRKTILTVCTVIKRCIYSAAGLAKKINIAYDGARERTTMENADNTDRLIPDISDNDIFEAMKDIQGYIDVTPAEGVSHEWVIERLEVCVQVDEIVLAKRVMCKQFRYLCL